MALVSVLLGMAWAGQPGAPAPDGPVRTSGELAAEFTAGDAEGMAPGTGGSRPGRVSGPATVADVPQAWARIAAQASAWPPAAEPPQLGAAATLPTVPASRMRDTLGLNIDLWRTQDGYRDFAPVLAKVTELRLRHARVGMQSTGEHGLARMQQLGRIGVRLDVVMGDAFGRYNTAPFSALDERLHENVMPYVDSVEGTNEPDLAGQPDWSARAKGHQGSVVQSVKAERRQPVAVVAPSLGRLANVPALGSYAGLADAANAHAYSSAGEPSAPLDQWAQTLDADQLPGGPVVVTEAGFQTDVGQTKYHTPLPAEIAASYTPRIVLEAIRRGMPRVYLYEMIDRWSDPFGVDTAAHFGLLHADLRPKPAWTAMVRLQRTLLDGGAPDRSVQALGATVVEGPGDLRALAFRRSDGTATLALWRAVSEWDNQALVATPAAPAAVKLELAGGVGGALATNVATGKRKRLPAGHTIALSLTGAPVLVSGLR